MSSLEDALRERGKQEHNDAIVYAGGVVLKIVGDYQIRWNKEVEAAHEDPPDYGDLMGWFQSRGEEGLELLLYDIRLALEALKYTDDD